MSSTFHFRGSSCFLFPPAIGLGSLLTASSAPDRPFWTIWCCVWSIDCSLIWLPPLWFGDGAKFRGWGAPAAGVLSWPAWYCPEGGTELLRVVGLWSRGYRCTFFLFLLNALLSYSSWLSTPIIC
jgi:hypothetical protein